MSDKAKDLKETYEQLNEETKDSLKGLDKLIKNNSMSVEDVVSLIDNKMMADTFHPELKAIEAMTSDDYSALYKEMAKGVKETPEKYEEHLNASGMTADELELLFTTIDGVIVRYPEVWEAKENAQLLHPRNLAILVSALKRDKK